MKRLALVLALVLQACGGQPWPGDLEPVAHPDLAAVEDAVRRQLEDARQPLDKLLDRGRGEALDLAGAFGGLGRLYHAYLLQEAAEACYANAERLDPESFLWPYYRGLLAQSSGRFAEAAAHFERALTIGPGNAPARLRLAEVRLALNEPRAPRGVLEALASDDRYGAAAHDGLGRADAAGGGAAAAGERYNGVHELRAQAGSVNHALGLALRRLGRGDEARRRLEAKESGEVSYPDPLEERLEALAVSSGSYLRRANRALMGGRLSEAVEAYRAAVEAAPDHVAARRNLALALVRLGRVDEAIEELERALESDPEAVRVHFDLGNCYRAKEAREKAIAAYRRAVELDPELTQARFSLANILGETNRWAEAAVELEKVLERQGDHRRARYLAAMAAHYLGRSRQALAQLEALVEEQPDDIVARQGLVAIHVGRKQPMRALAVYREALELELPADAELALLGAAAKLSWRHGRRAEAVELYRRAVELAPDSSAAHTDLANVLQLAGQREAAVDLFARAVELDPANGAAWLSEANLRILAGDYARAVERLDQALAHLGADPGLNHTLARLLATCPDAALRDGRRALVLAQKARAAEESIDHTATVAMALAELGQFEQAIQWQRLLIRQSMQPGQQAVLQRLVSHLKLYENGRPVRFTGPEGR